MYVAVKSNDLSLLNFIKQNIAKMSPSIVIDEKNNRLLVLSINQHKNEIRISSRDNKEVRLSMPFHFSEIFNKINNLQQNYNIKIGIINYYPARGEIYFDKNPSLLSQTQNQILSCLVCFKEGMDKKKLYQIIWQRDKNISENKLDTHLTNLRNHIFDFSNYKLKFKTLRGVIKLDIN